MAKQKTKPKRPRATQGYRIGKVYHNVKIPRINPSYKGEHSMGQKCMGLGVNGPNVSEHDPHRLIRMGVFFQRAGEFLLSLRQENK